MKSSFLLAVDSSDSSIRAARYVANLLGNNHNVFVTLFHVLRSVPPDLLEAGTLEEEDEINRKQHEEYLLTVQD